MMVLTYILEKECDVLIDKFEPDLMTINDETSFEHIIAESTYGVNSSVYIEGVMTSFGKFIMKVLSLITKLFGDVTEKVQEKIIQTKFKKKCKDFLIMYNRNKGKYVKTKIDYIDVDKYDRETNTMLRRMKDMYKEVKTRKWKDQQEFSDWCDKNFEAIYPKDIDEYRAQVYVNKVAESINTVTDKLQKMGDEAHDETTRLLNEINGTMDTLRSTDLISSIEYRWRMFVNKISLTFKTFIRRHKTIILFIIAAIVGIAW